jgi:hypothetical protein
MDGGVDMYGLNYEFLKCVYMSNQCVDPHVAPYIRIYTIDFLTVLRE